MVSIFQGVMEWEVEFIAVEAVGSIMQPVNQWIIQNIFFYSNYAEVGGTGTSHGQWFNKVKGDNLNLEGIEHCWGEQSLCYGFHFIG